MRLTDSEKQYILDQLDRLESQEVEAVIITEYAFAAWLKVVANWIFEKVIDMIGKVFQWVVSAFLR